MSLYKLGFAINAGPRLCVIIALAIALDDAIEYLNNAVYTILCKSRSTSSTKAVYTVILTDTIISVFI